MTRSDEALSQLPTEVRARLDGLREALAAALGDDLRALVVYGSAARGGYVVGRSDVDVIVILGRGERALLERIANPLLIARSAARIETMILVAEELASAADVFPLLYDDIRGCHVLLHGTDLFAALTIADTHRRLRIEQELREARIRLRHLLWEAPLLPRGLRGAIARKLKQLRGPFHALLGLRGEAPASDRIEPVMSAATAAYGVDARRLLGFEEAPEAAYDALVELLERAIADVDALAVEG